MSSAFRSKVWRGCCASPPLVRTKAGTNYIDRCRARGYDPEVGIIVTTCVNTGAVFSESGLTILIAFVMTLGGFAICREFV